MPLSDWLEQYWHLFSHSMEDGNSRSGFQQCEASLSGFKVATITMCVHRNSLGTCRQEKREFVLKTGSVLWHLLWQRSLIHHIRAPALWLILRWFSPISKYSQSHWCIGFQHMHLAGGRRQSVYSNDNQWFFFSYYTLAVYVLMYFSKRVIKQDQKLYILLVLTPIS